MDLGKKIFILAQSPERISDITKNILSEITTCKIESDILPDRGIIRIVKWQPDLLITEAAIGNITGYDVTYILRLIPSCACLSIIMIIKNEDEIYSINAIKSVIDMYMLDDEMLIPNLISGMKKMLFSSDAEAELVKRSIHRVLVVDDSRTMRRIIMMILAGIGIAESVEAENGYEGLEKLNEHGADMIIADYTMPRMNGLEMVRQIRKINKFESLPILILTAEGPEMIDSVLRAGANDYISKPFTMQQVRDAVRKFASNIQ